ncbi:MAG TPA: hypothetical protein VMA13_07475 [Candidatus Saccharimonadales bacterium]|nr:hypothetical protein [Candidatus Saccharimonadales bacterium]
MKTHIIKVIALTSLVTAMVAVPVFAEDQDANANMPSSADQTETPAPQKQHVIPFHGKLSAVDMDAMTLTVGKRTFQITAETKILNHGEPATLSDAVVGEPVRGAYKKTDADTLEAVSVYFGAKNEDKQEQESSDGN